MRDDSALPPRILIVEDEGIVALDIEKTLVDLGFEVTGKAASADEALECAAANRPDLVLMDIRIRGNLDGIETAELLRRDHDVPIAYLTAYGDADTIQRAKKTAPVGFLLKPFKQVELYGIVEISLHRARVERLLREREQLLATTLRSIGDAVLTTDADLAVTFMNAAAESLTGWGMGDALGRPLAQVLPLRDEVSGAELTAVFREALVRRAPQHISMAKLEAKDGAVRHVQDSVAPILDGTALRGTVVVITDVSERRQISRQLELTERLASLGTLAAGVGHEINNPLAFVSANLHFACDTVDRMRSDRPSETILAELGNALREARVGADRIGDIVGRLRSFVRRDAGSGSAEPAEPPARVDAPEPVLAPAAPVRGRVLVIDDEPLVLQAITRVLSSLHDVIAVRSGHEAVALLSAGEVFDLVLCDLMMPGMSGVEVHEWFQNERADLLPRFVFITGGATDAKSAELLASMANASVEKPFSPTLLRALVSTFVARARK